MLIVGWKLIFTLSLCFRGDSRLNEKPSGKNLNDSFFLIGLLRNFDFLNCSFSLRMKAFFLFRITLQKREYILYYTEANYPICRYLLLYEYVAFKILIPPCHSGFGGNCCGGRSRSEERWRRTRTNGSRSRRQSPSARYTTHGFQRIFIVSFYCGIIYWPEGHVTRVVTCHLDICIQIQG